MKKIKYLLFGIIFNFLGMTIVNASPSATLTVSSNSIVNGNSVTATVTLKETMGWDVKITSSGNTTGCTKSFVDVANSDTTKQLSVTCKSNGIGTITFKMSGAISNSKREKVNISGTKTVNVVKPREKSTNNNLKSLSVAGYDLSPSFNKNTLEYTVNVESNVEKVTINAAKEDGYASISGTGDKDVVEGDNKFEVKVTSETGSSKIYTVNVIVKDSNPITKVIDGKNYTVIKRGSVLTKPESFVDTKTTIDDTEIPAFYNEKLNLTLIGLKDDNGVIYLYKYNAETDKLEKYSSLTSKTQTIIFENDNVLKDGYTKTKVVINEQEYDVLQSNINKDYVLIYGINIEDNTKNWYLYNMKENSIQIYFDELINNMNNSFDKTIQEYKIVILGMSGLSILLLVVIIVLLITRNKNRQLKQSKKSEIVAEETKQKSSSKKKKTEK